MLADILEKAASVLTVAFVLAIIVERGLAVVFGWKKYVKYLNGKGYKVPISIAVSWAICWIGGLDVVAVMLGEPVPYLGTFLTALLISGGAKKFGEVFGDLKKGAEQVK